MVDPLRLVVWVFRVHWVGTVVYLLLAVWFREPLAVVFGVGLVLVYWRVDVWRKHKEAEFAARCDGVWAEARYEVELADITSDAWRTVPVGRGGVS